MKVKLLFLFFVIAIVGTVGVFYLKNYYFYTTTAEKIEDTQVTIEQTVGLISEEREKFQTYEGKVISAERLPLMPDTTKIEKLIMHFWASWCDPCINEIPELVAYLKRHSEEIKVGSIKIVLVSVDYELGAIEKFLKSFPDLNAPVYLQLWDPEGYLQKSFNIDRLPATIIVHKNPIDGKAKLVERYMAVVNWKQMP
ncbi:MAG: TlpA disulfide reductase family protein [Bdellovibrionota bacterium]